MCPSGHYPTADAVALRVKAFNEGKLRGSSFFAPNATYQDPMILTCQAPIAVLLYSVIWLFAKDVQYEVCSAYALDDKCIMIEAQTRYVWRWPLSWFMSRSPQHFYHTLSVDRYGQGGSEESWKCSKMVVIKDSYTLSLPARIVTAPPLLLLHLILSAGTLTSSLLVVLVRLLSEKLASLALVCSRQHQS